MVDLPPADHLALRQDTAYCVVTASQRFNLPVNGLLSMLLVESGKVGMRSSNTNGSFDLGPMQVNTVWLKEPSPLFGFVSVDDLQHNLCANIHSAAWIWASHVKKTQDLWSAVGYYHSRTPSKAWIYENRVNNKLRQAQAVIDNVPYYGYYMNALYGAKPSVAPGNGLQNP